MLWLWEGSKFFVIDLYMVYNTHVFVGVGWPMSHDSSIKQ